CIPWRSWFSTTWCRSTWRRPCRCSTGRGCPTAAPPTGSGCAPSRRRSARTAVFTLRVEHGLEALTEADTIVVPGRSPVAGPPSP
ncbi:LOW QUALITY PROTEIN: AraC-family transcriptional regulator, partial [Streptomyces sviceus ATCC 29083]